jgi:O-antigen ligase
LKNEVGTERSPFLIFNFQFSILPPDLPRPVRIAAISYLAHLLVQGWIASSEIFLAIALIAAAVAVWKRQLTIPFHILYFPLFLYALASSISALVSDRRIHLFAESALWNKLLIFPLAVALFVRIPAMRRLALLAFLGFGLFMSAFGLVQYFILHQRDLEHRITGPAPHVMTYSGLLLPISLLFLLFALHKRKPWLFAGAVVTGLSLLLTFTRSAWVGYGAAVIVLVMMRRTRWLGWAATLALWLVILSPLPIFGRLVSTFDLKQSSNFDRLRMAQAGVEIIKDYPLFGVGPANIKEVYPLYRRHDAPRFRIPHLHNNFLQIWAERGILALTGYVLLLILFLRETIRRWMQDRDIMAEAGILVAISLTAAGLFEFNFGDTEVLLAMLDLFALVIVSVGAVPPGQGRDPLARPATPVNGTPAPAVA